jgi:serine/threonine-protein kinase
MAMCVGDLIGGRYALEHLIGSGGMGDVFRAKDRVLERLVAVKLVYAGDPRKQAEVAKSFLREARISAAVSHPNVVQILDFGIHENAIPFMVLELLEGEPLAAVLSRGDAMTFDWILHVALQVLAGLSAAHAAGVVHRDLKPENIYLVRARDQTQVQAKILDFGISRVVEAEPDASKGLATTTGKVLGTPAYMSPEQARGQPNIDKRSDVYALGVVLYELISGSLPFYADNAFDLLTKIVNEEAIPLYRVIPDVEPALAEVVVRAMSKHPGERFADAGEMASALSKVADSLSGSSSARRLGEYPRPPSWRKYGTSNHNTELRPLPSDALDDSNQDARTDVFAAAQGKPARARSGLRVMTATAIFAALAGMALANSLLSPSGGESQHFIVVRADDRKAADEPAAIAAPAPQSPPEPIEKPAAPTPSVEKPRAQEEPEGPAQLLTRSFRKQKRGIVECVNEHAELASNTVDLGVRLSLDAEGHVLSARAAPEVLAQNPLGICIASAARAMKFPAPGAPITLQVPLTTKRGGPK